jgi:glycosyltransferase involved in cell wall biosynthesis
MRIVIVIGRLIHGGAETQFISLSKELVRRGHSVLFYTLRSDNPRLAELEGSGVEVVVDRKRLRFDPALAWRLRKRILAYRADVVQGVLLEGNLYALLATIATGIPAIASERNDAYYIPFQYQMAIRLTRVLASALVANTKAGAAFARNLYGLPAHRVHVVRNAVAVDANRGHSQDSASLFEPQVKALAVVGSIIPAKDQLLALRVFERLLSLDPQWRLLIVGDSPSESLAYKKTLAAEVQARQLSANVQLTGFRPDSLSIIKRSAVVLSTSRHEGCPNVVLEAMSVGTPVVSTAYSDIREILPLKWQICENRDPECLARAIIRADQDRDEVAEKQKTWIVENAALAEVAKDLESVYARYAVRQPSGNATDSDRPKARRGVVFVGIGIFPYRICGDKNFLLDLSDELNKQKIETRFVSIVNGPPELPRSSRFTFIDRAFHAPTEKHIRRDADASIIAYRHQHGLVRTWLEIAATLLSQKKTFANALSEFDDVVVHWMDSSLMLPVLRAACGPSARYVSTVFRYRAASGPAQKIRAYTMRGADRIVTGTSAARDLLIEGGCRPAAIVVAPWGCRVRELTKRDPGETRNLRILWSGFIQQIGRDDFLRTIALARRIRDQRADLDFVFSLKPECYSAEFAQLASPGVEVTIGSPTFMSELPRYDAFLSPVLDSQSSAAPPLTWLEAMSAGLPIITTEHPGAREVLESGNCGIVANDYVDLEQTLLDPRLASRLIVMQSAARERQRAEYNVETIGQRYADIYSSLFEVSQ